MKSRHLHYAVFSALCTLLRTTFSAPVLIDSDSCTDNANHIFNAVHSSMRQWGSSWHHNGMSFFLATVPADTQLYHGTGTPNAVNGTEWLAFEPEHALVFAHSWEKSPPGDKKDRRPPPSQEPLVLSKGIPDKPGQPGPPPPPRDRRPGWLHTYATKHPLSLLYVDGMSGGKSGKGTLDSQDFLLLNQSSSDDDPNLGDRSRAMKLCNMVNTRWQNKVDGILRMEAGFEIILCDFERHLDLVRVIRAGGEPKEGSGSEGGDLWPWVRAITSRYSGIGGGRVTLNYDNFVTAFTYNLNLFKDNEAAQPTFPRLQNISSASLKIVREDVDDLIATHAGINLQTTNWQSKADMIVTRYSTFLLDLLTIQNATLLQTKITSVLLPFIDIDHRNSTAEIDRCTYQFLPYPSRPSTSSPLSLAYTSLLKVSNQICSTLVSLIPPSPRPDAISTIKSLVTYLDWSSFADCPEKCALDEVCFIPIWPLGSKADRASGHGLCVNSSSVGGRGDYWDDGLGRRHGSNGGPRLMVRRG